MTTTIQAAAEIGATADDVEQEAVYYPRVRPGYTSWCVLWNSPTENSTYLVFTEKRRAPNPLWKPVPLDFFESMGLPSGYHIPMCDGAKDVITESVVLKSRDDGRCWTEVGRSASKMMVAFSWNSLRDGRLARIYCDDYVAFDPAVLPKLRMEVSSDEGNSWHEQSILMEGYHVDPYRLKQLRDGTLVHLAVYQDGFGPARTRQGRLTLRQHVHQELTAGMFYSIDDGASWLGPVTVFPGIKAYEPDFVELPSGDLLFVNSSVQRGPQVRQIVRRNCGRFLPGPVFDVISGIAPETMARRSDGLLVGATRHGIYSCSNDQGESWHSIAGLPKPNYQPYITAMPDGGFLCAWHIGGDNAFGEVDQWIGTHRFRVRSSSLPRPVSLRIWRNTNAAGDKYVNRYSARLCVDDQPLAGRTVRFAYHLRYTPEYDKTDDPLCAGISVESPTGPDGIAHLDLSNLDRIADIHQSYRVAASFVPNTADRALTSARSDVYTAYTITMAAGELNGG